MLFRLSRYLLGLIPANLVLQAPTAGGEACSLPSKIVEGHALIVTDFQQTRCTQQKAGGCGGLGAQCGVWPSRSVEAVCKRRGEFLSLLRILLPPSRQPLAVSQQQRRAGGGARDGRPSCLSLTTCRASSCHSLSMELSCIEAHRRSLARAPGIQTCPSSQNPPISTRIPPHLSSSVPLESVRRTR